MGTFDDLNKIDLHCHLDGSLSEETIRKLADNVQMQLPKREELLLRIQAGEDCKSLKEYLDCFDLPLTLLQTETNLEEAVKSVLKDAARERVIYMEIRFAPLLSTAQGLSCEQVIASAVKGLKTGEELYGVKGNLILCGMRNMTPEENLKMLKGGMEFYQEGVCAVDVAGDEAAFPIMGQKAFLEEAKKLGIPFTIHAGECGSAKSVRDAIALGASRIGHGIAVQKDMELFKECQKRRMPLEMCPISNLQTKAVSSIEEYPFEKFYQAGLHVTINTDNRTVSNTTLTKELEWLEKHFSLTREDAALLMKSAADAAFVPENMKYELKKRIV